MTCLSKEKYGHSERNLQKTCGIHDFQPTFSEYRCIRFFTETRQIIKIKNLRRGKSSKKLWSLCFLLPYYEELAGSNWEYTKKNYHAELTAKNKLSENKYPPVFYTKFKNNAL